MINSTAKIRKPPSIFYFLGFFGKNTAPKFTIIPLILEEIRQLKLTCHQAFFFFFFLNSKMSKKAPKVTINKNMLT